MAIKSARQREQDGATPTTRVAAQPTGRAAPTTPPTVVDPAVQAAMELVEPAPGFALARLVLAAERQAEMGLPPETNALLDSAMLRLIRLHSSDDLFARDYPAGSVVFASLEGLAPLLASHVFLLPLERVQGVLPGAASAAGEPAEPVGFRD